MSERQARTFALFRGTRWPRVAFLLVLVLALMWLLGWLLARGLIVHSEPSRAEALMVLSGSSNYVERTRGAAELFRQGKAPLIVVTNDNLRGGWSSAEQRNPFFFEREVDELRAAGVGADRIVVLELPVTSTFEEATLLRQYAVSHNLRSVIVVTSAYHSRRALSTMRHVFDGSGIAIGIEPVATGQESPGPATWWLHRRGWREVASEYGKLIYYRVHYGVR